MESIRSFEDVGNHLVESCQPLFSLEIMSQIVLFPLFEPLLRAIIELPQKVSAYLMIEHSLDGETSVPDRQSNHDRAHRLHVIMHHTRVRYRILSELVVQVFTYLQFFNVLLEALSCLLHAQRIALPHQLGKVYLCSLLEDAQSETKILTMGAAVFHVLFVFFVHYVGDVGVQEEWISLKVALEEECLLFFEIERLEFFETGGEVGFFLALYHGLLHLGLLLDLHLDFYFLLPLLLLF